jgi:hypothetical protein
LCSFFTTEALYPANPRSAWYFNKGTGFPSCNQNPPVECSTFFPHAAQMCNEEHTFIGYTCDKKTEAAKQKEPNFTSTITQKTTQTGLVEQ